jgi:uncharacterized protein YbjT (DUF2867 family)
MKIVVIGGSGRIGKKLVEKLRQAGCEVIAASPTHGVDAVTGVGLTSALIGADIVIDVSNAPSIEGAAALRFFETAGRNLVAAGRSAGVRHHIVLSIVGVERLLASQSSDYFRAKTVQEDLVRGSGLPFTIVRSTQFFEFISGVVQEGSAGEIAISPALVQPIAGDDVAAMLADTGRSEALGDVIEIAGPEQFRLDEVATEIATAYEDGRHIVADPHARYFGVELEEDSLLPGPKARIASLRFDDWLRDWLRIISSRSTAGRPVSL